MIVDRLHKKKRKGASSHCPQGPFWLRISTGKLGVRAIRGKDPQMTLHEVIEALKADGRRAAVEVVIDCAAGCLTTLEVESLLHGEPATRLRSTTIRDCMEKSSANPPLEVVVVYETKPDRPPDCM